MLMMDMRIWGGGRVWGCRGVSYLFFFLSFSRFFFLVSLLFSFLLLFFSGGNSGHLADMYQFTADSNDAVLGFQFSYMTKSIYTGLVMTCDSNANICTTCTKQSAAGQAPAY